MEVNERGAVNEDDSKRSACTLVTVKILVLDIILYALDSILDGVTVYEYIQNCNYQLALITSIFIMLPTLPTFFEFLRKKGMEIRSGEALYWFGKSCCVKTQNMYAGLVYLHLVFVLYFVGGAIIVTILQFLKTLKNMFMNLRNPPGKDGKLTADYQKAFNGKYKECQLEAAPQCIFQVNN